MTKRTSFSLAALAAVVALGVSGAAHASGPYVVQESDGLRVVYPEGPRGNIVGGGIGTLLGSSSGGYTVTYEGPVQSVPGRYTRAETQGSDLIVVEVLPPSRRAG